MGKDNGYRCSDCGKPMNRPGTCTDCLIKDQPVPEKLLKDLGKKGGKGK